MESIGIILARMLEHLQFPMDLSDADNCVGSSPAPEPRPAAVDGAKETRAAVPSL